MRGLVLVLVLLLSAYVPAVLSGNLDRFNYGQTEGRDFGPEDWNQVTCDDVEQCLGWPDDWLLGVGWSLTANSCRWCPKDNSNCGAHHQSPIDLNRDRGVPGHPLEKECIDSHWMKYEDSSCTWDRLESKKSFSIERHALKITQPLEATTNGGFRLDCPGERGRRFGKIDFSKGFSQWWFLSHIDVKVPSEHTQDGKRYSAEIQMAHFYSVSGEVAGVDNEMAHVSIFLQVYDDAPPYPFLDRLICQWRKVEEETRSQCSLPSIPDPYPGCWTFQRGGTATGRSAGDVRRNLRTRKSDTAFDVFAENRKANSTHAQKKLIMDDINFRDAEWTDEQWAEWIESLSAASQNATTGEQRKLLEGYHQSFHNYQFLIDVKTEYYFRYSGTSTVPPCYGPFTPQTRGFTNHWRVLKDPIRIHERQLTEIQRLLKERVAPPSDPLNPCQPDTAASVTRDEATGKDIVSVARPLQDTANTHYKVFCECKDWSSKWPEDREWCGIQDINQRFYNHPYNFKTEGY